MIFFIKLRLLKQNYNYSEFNNMVASYPMPDHYPPNFIQIEDFCKNVQGWLTQNKKNVAVVHCKAGKVRIRYLAATFIFEFIS